MMPRATRAAILRRIHAYLEELTPAELRHVEAVLRMFLRGGNQR